MHTQSDHDTQEDDLFDILTQNLGANDDNELPEVDELFSQVPLLSDFEFGLPQDQSPLLDSTPDICEWTDVQAETQQPPCTRFGPLVSASNIVTWQKASVPVNTRKNNNWGMNVW